MLVIVGLFSLALASPVTHVGEHPHATAAPRSGADNLGRDTLAWVGAHGITAADLVRRIEWMPWQEKEAGAAMDSAKVHALQSLVAEELLAQEAEREALGDSGRVGRMREALRRALVRDALYREVAAGPAPDPLVVDRAVRAHPRPATANERRALRQAVTDSLRAMAGQQRAIEFMGSVLGPQRVTVDSTTLMLLADSLRTLMVASRESRASPRGYALLGEDVDVLLTRLAHATGRTLARLPGGPLLLGDALEDLRFHAFTFRSLEPHAFAVELSAGLKSVVADELMTREGMRRHLDRDPDVRSDLAMWTSAWRAHMLLMRAAAGPAASDDDAFRRFALLDPQRARETSEVDVAEILSGSLEGASRTHALAAAGANFDSLARRLTIRADWRSRGGRSGFFPVARHPRLGYAALLAPLDSLLGPLRLAEGYAVFRVLGKRLVPDSVSARGELSRARDVATAERRAGQAGAYIASLAEKSDVRIDYAALSKVEILSANMFTRRLLGFGGGMLAAPSLPPLWQWVPIREAAHLPRP